MILLPVVFSYFGILDARYVNKYLRHGLAYSNPLIIGVAICYLLFFLKVDVKSKVVNWIAISSFSAFLIHANPNIIRIFKAFVVRQFESNTLACYIAFVIIFIISVFVVSILIDKIRMYLWKQLWSNIEKHYVR